MWCGLTENIIKRKMVRRSQDGIKHKTFGLEAAKIMLGLRPLKTKVLVHVFVWQAITNINETIVLKLVKILGIFGLTWTDSADCWHFPLGPCGAHQGTYGCVAFFCLVFPQSDKQVKSRPRFDRGRHFWGSKTDLLYLLGPMRSSPSL